MLPDIPCTGPMSLSYRPSFLHHPYAMACYVRLRWGSIFSPMVRSKRGNVINGQKVIYAAAWGRGRHLWKKRNSCFVGDVTFARERHLCAATSAGVIPGSLASLGPRNDGCGLWRATSCMRGDVIYEANGHL